MKEYVVSFSIQNIRSSTTNYLNIDDNVYFAYDGEKMGDLRGYSTDYKYAVQSSMTDTLRYNVGVLKDEGMNFGDELGIGVSIRSGERWSAEFDYVRSDWRSSGMDKAPGFSTVGTSTFSSSVSQSFRAGFEIVPNRNDIRYYFRKCAYRAGVYYDQAYYKLDGNNVNSLGLTLGITLPVFRLYNGLITELCSMDDVIT